MWYRAYAELRAMIEACGLTIQRTHWQGSENRSAPLASWPLVWYGGWGGWQRASTTHAEDCTLRIATVLRPSQHGDVGFSAHLGGERLHLFYLPDHDPSVLF